MVPHAAMGANQAMESAAALANELLELNDGQGDDGWTASNITIALEKYTQVRCNRVGIVISKAGAICRAQMLCPGHDHLVKALPKLGFADWMTQAFFSFRGASLIESLPLTERGKYYNDRLKLFFDNWDDACIQAEEDGTMPRMSDEKFWKMFQCSEWKA